MQTMSSKDERLLHASELFDGQSHQITQVDYELLASDEVRAHMQSWSLIRGALRRELHDRYDPAFSQKLMRRIREEQELMSEPVPEQRGEEELPSLLKDRKAFASAAAGMESGSFGAFETRFVGAYENRAVGAYENRAVGAYENRAVGAYENRAVGAYENRAVGAYENRAVSAPDACEDQISANLNVTARQTSSRGAGLRDLFSLKRIGVFTTQVALAASVAVVSVIGVQIYQASDISVQSTASTASTNTGSIGGLSLASYQGGNNMLVKVDKGASNTSLQSANSVSGQDQELKRINAYVNGYISEHHSN